MAAELLDVIDTAVKVGLGGAISGIAAYTAAKFRHRSELRRELAARRVDLMTAALDEMEPYFLAFNRCFSHLMGYLQAGAVPGPFTGDQLASYRQTDRELLLARDGRRRAASRLTLIGEGQIARLLMSDVIHAERKLRDKVIFQMELPSRGELEQIAAEMLEIQASVYAQVSAAFKNAYA